MLRLPRCPLCQDPLRSRNRRSCPACETQHHADCWAYHGGCTTYGCLGVLPGATGELALTQASSVAGYLILGAFLMATFAAAVAYVPVTAHTGQGRMVALVIGSLAALCLLVEATRVEVVALDQGDAWLSWAEGPAGLLRGRRSTMRLTAKGARVLWRSRIRNGVAHEYELMLQVPEEGPHLLASVPSQDRGELKAFGHRLARALRTPLERARSI